MPGCQVNILYIYICFALSACQLVSHTMPACLPSDISRAVPETSASRRSALSTRRSAGGRAGTILIRDGASGDTWHEDRLTENCVQKPTCFSCRKESASYTSQDIPLVIWQEQGDGLVPTPHTSSPLQLSLPSPFSSWNRHLAHYPVQFVIDVRIGTIFLISRSLAAILPLCHYTGFQGDA